MTVNRDKQNIEFIAKYRAAIESKLSREEFAEYMDVLPRSVIKRRLLIEKNTGMRLKILETDPTFNGGIDPDKLVKFELLYEKYLVKEAGPSNIDISSPNKKQVFVYTAAQNATPIHENFWATLLKYKEIRNAELGVIPYRYKNPNSIWTDKKHDWWFTGLGEYLVTDQTKVCKGLNVLAQIKITPTATTPLSGFEAFTGSDSGIFGHPKVQLKTIATPNKKMPKIQVTTGACTIENYTDSKAGHKGRFHHSCSALIVEIDDDKFHIRHVHAADDGSFYDLEYHYTPHGRTKYGRVAAFISGDLHAEFIDTDVENATFKGDDSIVGVLRPEVMVYQDADDFYRRNHHHRGNDIIAYGKHHFGRNNVEEGLQITADFIDKYTRPDTLNLVTAANHNEAFDRWLLENDPKYDPENSLFFYYMKYMQMKNIKPTATGFKTFSAFEFWCKNPMPEGKPGLKSVEQTKFLQRDESFMVADVEIGFHGDERINGGGGGLAAFSKIGPKVVIGHSHSPGIIEGAYQTGLSARLDLEYQRGPSSWLHTHCLVYPDGSRTLINVINGEWRASYYDREYEISK